MNSERMKLQHWGGVFSIGFVALEADVDPTRVHSKVGGALPAC